jgi:hypothetical protein
MKPKQSQAEAAQPLSVEDVLRAEATAIAVGAKLDRQEGTELYRALNHRNFGALCLSGGGIRSAAFALGVIEALAAHPRDSKGNPVDAPAKSLLRRFHYLSTVSGGGYIGSWLSAWVKRDGFPLVWQNLVDMRTRPEREPVQIGWLRAYSNYLTPRLGIFSADTWAAVALTVRNLLLNWLIIVPALCVVLLGIKWLAFGAFVSSTAAMPLRLLLGLATVLSVGGLAFATFSRPSRWKTKDEREGSGARDALPRDDENKRAAPGAGQPLFLLLGLGPSLLSAALLTLCLMSNSVSIMLPRATLLGAGVLAGALIYALSWLLGWIAAEVIPLLRQKFKRESGAFSFRDFIAWLVAGAIYGALIAFGIDLLVRYTSLFTSSDAARVLVLIVCGIPWIVTSQLTAEMIFVGLTSWQPKSDEDREWFGRSTGWFAVVAIGWTVVFSLVLIGSAALSQVYHPIAAKVASWGIAGVTAAAGAATAILGKSSITPAFGQPASNTGLSYKRILVFTAPLFLIGLVIGLSTLLDALLLSDSFLKSPLMSDRASGEAMAAWKTDLSWLFGGTVIFLGIAFLASYYVNINRFSLHALYRNRLIRAFLGASNTERRRPNRFTGFDQADNIAMHELWPPKSDSVWQPFHVVNIALNVVSARRLAWQERMARPFTVSPLHSGTGSIDEPGYRPSRRYGHEKEGISLGTALAISGAAVSPNMGYNSSPLVTLTLALFNVRLGWWLGNPIKKKYTTYDRQAPRFALLPLLAEMFGWTTDDRRYVYLSDGGHFDNLGLYEMVRRRCRFIVVSDAGCDPKFEFEDLGNAVRKIWLDLGVSITFKGLNDLKRRADKDVKYADDQPPFHAVGTIDYDVADRPTDPKTGAVIPNVPNSEDAAATALPDSKDSGSKKGYILYLKAAYHANRIENVGIRNYAMAHPEFPHEGTLDQFFSESQFESYRVLGYNTMDAVLKQAFKQGRDPSIEEMFENLPRTLIKTGPADSKTPRRRRAQARKPSPATRPD